MTPPPPQDHNSPRSKRQLRSQAQSLLSQANSAIKVGNTTIARKRAEEAIKRLDLLET